MPSDIFDQITAQVKPKVTPGIPVSKQDIFDQIGPQQMQIPDATAQAQQSMQKLAGQTIQYTPERKFEMNVAKGFGLNPDQLAAAESSGGNQGALLNIGGQALSGATRIATRLPGAAVGVLKDPLRAITSPIDAMASNIVRPTGLPDTGSAFDPKGYSQPNPGQLVGALAGTEAIGRVGENVISPLARYITSSKSLGAEMLQRASVKAGSAPVELSARTNDLVDKLVESSKSGGSPVKVISDLLERLGPSTKQAAEATPGPLSYNEARLFQGSISDLSAEESMKLKGSQKGLMKQLAGSFSTDVQAAADKAGIGREHAIGMSEYATASARNRVLANAGKLALKGGAIGAGTEVAKYLWQKR